MVRWPWYWNRAQFCDLLGNTVGQQDLQLCGLAGPAKQLLVLKTLYAYIHMAKSLCSFASILRDILVVNLNIRCLRLYLCLLPIHCSQQCHPAALNLMNSDVGTLIARFMEPHVGPMNLAIWIIACCLSNDTKPWSVKTTRWVWLLGNLGYPH